MSFLKSLFHKKEEPINTYAQFWDWFLLHEQDFYKVIKDQGDVKNLFFDVMSPKLDEIKDGFWFLAGMYDESTAELIVTADGVVKNIVFIEELVAAAPSITNWKITALKQPSDLNQFAVQMDEFKFDKNTISFYATDHEYMPDEIDITLTHKDFSEENSEIVTNGTFIALDNTLGELNSVTTIDNVDIINPKDATEELIPLEKLKDFLTWREKEFVEKYKGLRHDTENDNYSGLEATLDNGMPLIAIVNTDLLNWDSKASHPWIAVVEIKYNGNDSGMPGSSDYKLLDEIEAHILEQLKDADGYLNIGRQTAESAREIYFACVEFRKPSKVLYHVKEQYKDKIDLDFEIYRDKYWQSFDRFMQPS